MLGHSLESAVRNPIYWHFPYNLFDVWIYYALHFIRTTLEVFSALYITAVVVVIVIYLPPYHNEVHNYRSMLKRIA